MYLVLVRHTQPQVDSGICYGQLDVPLQEGFELKFEKIKNFLKEFEPYKVITSPSSRCKQLASFLRNHDFIENPALLEMNFGAWEGKTWDEIPKEEIELWYNNFVNYKIPNGESFFELYFRVIQFFQKSEFPQNQVWITHAGVIRAIVCEVLHLDLQNAFQFEVDLGGLTILQKKYGKWNVKTLNLILEPSFLSKYS